MAIHFVTCGNGKEFIEYISGLQKRLATGNHEFASLSTDVGREQ